MNKKKLAVTLPGAGQTTTLHSSIFVVDIEDARKSSSLILIVVTIVHTLTCR